MEKDVAGGTCLLPGGPVGCVMVHGFGSSPGEVMGLGRYLHQLGYTVYGVLLKGHGTSPEDLARTSWPDWYVSVTGGIEQLRQQCRQVWVIGLSLGGALSLYAASQGLVDGVVALAAPAGLADWRVRLVGIGKYIMPYQHRRISRETQAFNAKVGRMVYDRLPLRAVQSLYQFIGIVRKALPQVTVPVLVVHSLKDEVISQNSGRYIYEHVSSTQKEYLELQQSGHILTEGPEKEVVWQKVEEFLSKYAPLDPQ
ncbi:MAG TPA: alpha/beta fold hydrolase [Clostridia bacterium]|nr:alpha/beta fold hydrolase [Clostridia bacterium]